MSQAFRSTTGAKPGAHDAPEPERRLASRRQPKICCGDIPWRRATSDVTAPGANVSAMIRALSSTDQRRRRPVPVITSTRRTPASGSKLCSSIRTSRSPNHTSDDRSRARKFEHGVKTALTVKQRRLEFRGEHLAAPMRPLGA